MNRCFPERPLFSQLLPHECGKERSLFQMERDFVVNTPDGYLLGVVPKGYVTNFASIPGFAKWWLDNDDSRISFPSILHDWFYSQGFNRAFADRWLRELMIECGARVTMAWVVWLSVRIGGRGHWVAPRKEAA
jgi:hypothetical protein